MSNETMRTILALNCSSLGNIGQLYETKNSPLSKVSAKGTCVIRGLLPMILTNVKHWAVICQAEITETDRRIALRLLSDGNDGAAHCRFVLLISAAMFPFCSAAGANAITKDSILRRNVSFNFSFSAFLPWVVTLWFIRLHNYEGDLQQLKVIWNPSMNCSLHLRTTRRMGTTISRTS